MFKSFIPSRFFFNYTTYLKSVEDYDKHIIFSHLLFCDIRVKGKIKMRIYLLNEKNDIMYYPKNKNQKTWQMPRC